MVFHPEVSCRSCDDCRALIHDDKVKQGSGAWEFGAVKLWRGKPVKRPKGVKTPCDIDRSACPKGHYDKQRTLSPQNVVALLHYRECRASGRFPDDPIVSHNAAIIRAIEDQKDRHDKEAAAMLLKLAAARL